MKEQDTYGHEQTSVFGNCPTAAKECNKEDKTTANQNEIDGDTVQITADNIRHETAVNSHPYSNAENNCTNHLNRVRDILAAFIVYIE